jgi:RNA polymerase sigma factor (sigma-70 family)
MGSWEHYFQDIHTNKEAREALYRETRRVILPTLEAWIPRELKPRWEAEDLLHEAFLRATENLQGFEWRGEDSWRNFVLTIARHCIQDALKRKSRLDVRFAHESQSAGLRGSQIADRAPRASGIACDRDSVEAVLKRLRASDAEVIRLKLFEALSDEALAKRLGKSVDAARKAFQRAMVRFAAVGKELWPSDDR